MLTSKDPKSMIVDSIFYKGGTIYKEDIQETTLKDYSIAFNDNYLFIFKNNKLLKAIKYVIDYEYTYKIQKTQININRVDGYIKFAKDAFWSVPFKNQLLAILNNN